MPAPLLEYAIQPAPNPLRASTTGSLTIVATNPIPESPIVCESISVTFSRGPNAADLTVSPSTIQTPQPPGWTAALQGTTYTAKPNGGSTRIVNSVRLELDAIDVNDQMGVTHIFIDEVTARGTDKPQLRSVDPEPVVSKFPKEFKLGELRATPDTVQSGGSTSLMWTGTDMPGLATYRLSWVSGGVSHDIPVEHIGPKTIDNLDTEPDTVFRLEAKVAGLPDSVVRKESVNVIPNAPVIDRFTGQIEGRRIRLRWEARYGECFIDSVKYAATGEAVLPLDRICYVLTCRNKTRSVRFALVLELTKTAERSERGYPWPALAVTPDASSLIGIGFTRCVQLDGVSLAQRKVLATSTDGTYAAVSGDGRLVCVAAGETAGGRQTSALTLYDDRMQPIANAKVGAGRVMNMAFTPDGDSLYVVAQIPSGSSSSFTLYRFVASTLEKVSEKELSGTWALALCTSPSGDRVFIGANKTLLSLDTRSGASFSAPTDLGSGASAASWRVGDDLLLAVSANYRTGIFEGRTLQRIASTGWGVFIKTAAELLVVTENLYGVDVIDRATRSLLYTIDIDSRGTYASPIAFASGVLYVARMTGEQTTLMRYVATSATPLDLPRLDLLADGDTLLAAGEASGPVTIDFDGDETVRVEAPEGWQVAREGGRFTFTPAAPREREFVTFTFRGASPGAMLRVVPPAAAARRL